VKDLSTKFKNIINTKVVDSNRFNLNPGK